MTKQLLKIATRKSPLALWQAKHVAACLKRHWPELQTELVPLVTSGDKFLKDKLYDIGGKGLFVKELEEALLDGRADIAVHSMKDVPQLFPEGLGIPVIMSRDDPWDAMISLKTDKLEDLPKGAVIGTSSLRRQSQLLRFRSDFILNNLRGNIHTRLLSLEHKGFDAIILAAAGLKRMNLEANIKQILPKSIMLPACGQGALGIECRLNDALSQYLIAPLNDETTALCVQTERSVNASLGGSCHVPMAVYAEIKDHENMELIAKVFNHNGSIMVSDTQEGLKTSAFFMAERCAENLKLKGAQKLLNP